MIQRLVQSSGLDIFAQIGLVAFIIAFILVLVQVFLLDSDEANRRAEMPLANGAEQGDASSSRATGSDAGRSTDNVEHDEDA